MTDSIFLRITIETTNIVQCKQNYERRLDVGAMDAIKSFRGVCSSFVDKQPLDTDTFIDLYESYYKKVYNYISYRINNQSDVEELVSSVFETVIRKYYTYRPNRSPVEAWVIGIAKITVADYFRSAKKRVFVSIETITDITSVNHQPDEIAVMNEENAELLKALRVLTDKERNIMSMKFATELTNSEIADITGLSKTNVGTIINRAVNKLRKELERKVQI